MKNQQVYNRIKAIAIKAGYPGDEIGIGNFIIAQKEIDNRYIGDLSDGLKRWEKDFDINNFPYTIVYNTTASGEIVFLYDTLSEKKTVAEHLSKIESNQAQKTTLYENGVPKEVNRPESTKDLFEEMDELRHTIVETGAYTFEEVAQFDLVKLRELADPISEPVGTTQPAIIEAKEDFIQVDEVVLHLAKKIKADPENEIRTAKEINQECDLLGVNPEAIYRKGLKAKLSERNKRIEEILGSDPIPTDEPIVREEIKPANEEDPEEYRHYLEETCICNLGYIKDDLSKFGNASLVKIIKEEITPEKSKQLQAEADAKKNPMNVCIVPCFWWIGNSGSKIYEIHGEKAERISKISKHCIQESSKGISWMFFNESELDSMTELLKNNGFSWGEFTQIEGWLEVQEPENPIKKVREARAVEMEPYIKYIRDYEKMIALPGDEFLQELNEVKKGAIEAEKKPETKKEPEKESDIELAILDELETVPEKRILTELEILEKPLSYSGSKKLLQSPADYMQAQQKGYTSTKATIFGSLVHTMFLEPDTFPDEYILFDPENRPETEKGMTSKKNKEWKQSIVEIAEKNGLEIVTQEEIDKAKRMSEALEIYFGKYKAGASNIETMHYGEYTTTKGNTHAIRVKTDVDGKSFAMDVKTAQSAEESEFTKNCIKLHYHLQVAFTFEILKHIKYFLFAVIEKEPKIIDGIEIFPQNCFIVERGSDIHKLGVLELEKAVDTIEDCRRKGSLKFIYENPETGKISRTLEYPRWALKGLK